VQLAIEHFTRGKEAGFDLDMAVLGLRRACADRPELIRVFLELQLRAAIAGSGLEGPSRGILQRCASLLGVSQLELAHLEVVLRIRRGSGETHGSRTEQPARMRIEDAYEVLEVQAAATDEEVVKAYRRQLSKHHPDKLVANGLPESMLEHAKQRTQQIIEAYELIRERRGLA
jgi:DnaJ like chaperone protein